MTKEKMTIQDFKRYKKEGRIFTYGTAYDYTMASIVNESKMEILLVGDSLGMFMWGYPDTRQVTMEDVVYALKQVVKGAPDTFIVGDMPFGSYTVSIEKAIENANRLYQAGCDCVKLEGGEDRVDVIKAIVGAGIPVMGHLGMTEQTSGMLGGFKVQGATEASAARLLEEALMIQEAGCFSVVLECVVAGVAKKLTKTLEIPTLSFGAGPHCDCQVLCTHDLIGMSSGFVPKYLKKFGDVRGDMLKALNRFHEESSNGTYPGTEFSYNTNVKGFEA